MLPNRRCFERGSAMPFYAVVLTTILLPLMSLSIDIVSFFYARTHLQAAVDAACEAAAQALDTAHFVESGEARILPGRAWSWAGREFHASLLGRQMGEYSPSLDRVALQSATVVTCSASAQVRRFIPFTPPMQAIVYSVSEMKVGRQ